MLQEDLAKEISRELLGRLTAEDERRLSRRYTEDAEAYQAYLQGRHHILTRTEEGFGLAIEYFQEAIDKDPSYALAYAGMADGFEEGQVRVRDVPTVSNWKSERTKAIQQRKAFFEILPTALRIPGAKPSLDPDSPDRSWRSASVHVAYPGHYLDDLGGLFKSFVLLEIGSARLTPFVPCDLTSLVQMSWWRKVRWATSWITDRKPFDASIRSLLFSRSWMHSTAACPRRPSNPRRSFATSRTRRSSLLQSLLSLPCPTTKMSSRLQTT